LAVNVFTVTLAGELLGTFDEKELTLADAFTIENTTGLTVIEMLEGVAPMKPNALRALVWFMRYKAGNPPHISTIDFKLLDLKLEAVEDPTVQEPAVATVPEPATSETSETVTSEPLPSSVI